MTLTDALIEKGVARNAEEAATEIEKALPEFHDLVEYDVDYTSDDIISFTDRRWGIKDRRGDFAEELFGNCANY
ncbi:MAG: hypothetical protein GX565_07980 [Lentisphaerae bacterium]|nr:hypothetical protein [Lentisphaerota bacterium]OQC23258.1 MAG: hypothetical protein BWX70_02870 [Verrucomicrobia bacterium ADurb.Bin070]